MELHAQNAEYFHFAAPKEKISGSLYNSINFIDSRADTSNLGYMYGGLAGRRLPVLVKIDLYTQFNWLLYYLTDSSAKNNELVFQLRKFELDEDADGRYRQKGTCALRADLYCKKNTSYFKIARLDTTIFVKAAEVSQLLVEASTNAIIQALKHTIVSYKNEGIPYLYHEILKMDSVDKSDSTLFIQDSLSAGIYLTFESFRTQKPDLTIIQLNSLFGRITSIKAKNKNGRQVMIFPRETYALVYNNKAYVSKESNFYILKKEQDDFYFITELKNPAKNLGLQLSMFTELATGTYKRDLERQNRESMTALFKVRLDHIDGSLVIVNKIIQ